MLILFRQKRGGYFLFASAAKPLKNYAKSTRSYGEFFLCINGEFKWGLGHYKSEWLQVFWLIFFFKGKKKKKKKKKKQKKSGD